MPYPVHVLQACRKLLAEGGSVIVGDERVPDEFNPPADEVERFYYGFTMKETKLAESGLVDDQAEWLNDQTILYGTGDRKVWQLPADGSGAPRRFLDDALSPAVIAAAAPAGA